MSACFSKIFCTAFKQKLNFLFFYLFFCDTLHMTHDTLGRVNFCQKHPNMSADDFYCVFGCTDQPQQVSE